LNKRTAKEPQAFHRGVAAKVKPQEFIFALKQFKVILVELVVDVFGFIVFISV